jgi:choline dehydrogenase-like flavoprotein
MPDLDCPPSYSSVPDRPDSQSTGAGSDDTGALGATASEGMKDLYDAIVIGSGAGGGTAAYRLTRAGMKVLLLEQGPRYRPFRDYPLGRNDWERLDHFERHLPDSYVSSTQPLGAEAAPLMSGLYGRPLKRKPEAKFEYARAAGIGGSTLRYQAEVHRFPEHAFRMKSRFGIARDWPLTYGDLEPYYREAEELLGVAGDHRNPFKPPRDPFPMPAHPLGCPSRRVREGAAKLGLTLTPNSLAIPNRRYRGRPACIYCRACGYGCVIGDKGSVDVVMIKPAEATGMLTIQTGARVLRIEADRKGRAEAVLWKDGTGTHTSHGRAIVAAGGAIETPRLLLNSRSAAFPDGLANGGGLVGSSLMTHLSVMLMVFFDEDVKSYQGLPIDSRIWDFSAPERVKDQGTGFSLGVMGAPEGIVSPSKFALVIPGWGKDHRDKMKRFYGAHSAIFGVADQNPKETNTVRLAGTKDAEGMPKGCRRPRFTSRFRMTTCMRWSF